MATACREKGTWPASQLALVADQQIEDPAARRVGDGRPQLRHATPAARAVRGGVAAAILEKLGVRAEAVRASARSPRAVPAAGQPSQEPPPESAEARDTVHGAAALARRGGCGYVGTEHLLGALALDPGSRARRVLVRLGVSILAIKKELECYTSPVRPRRRRRGKAVGPACSFCGKLRADGLRLVAGPGVYICAECIGLCNEILTTGADPPGQTRR